MNALKWHTGLSALMLAGFAATASAQNVELRFAHWLPEPHPIHQTGFKPWAESIHQASNGSISVTFYPAQQLGAASDHHDMAQDGIADLTWTNMGYQPGRFPIAGAAEVPFVIGDSEAGSRAYHEWYAQYAPREVDGARVCLVHLQPTGAMHSKEPITHPDDLEGMTLRPPNATMGRFFQQLGAANVQVAAPEAREALVRGTADALAFPWDSIHTFGMDEVVKYHLDMPMYVSVFGIIMNERTYNGMTDAQKAVMDEHCSGEWAPRIMAGWNASNLEGRERFKADSDHDVATPTDAELQAWLDAANSLRQGWLQDVSDAGHDAQAIWADLEEHLRAAGALYE